MSVHGFYGMDFPVNAPTTSVLAAAPSGPVLSARSPNPPGRLDGHHSPSPLRQFHAGLQDKRK